MKIKVWKCPCMCGSWGVDHGLAWKTPMYFEFWSDAMNHAYKTWERLNCGAAS